MQNNMMREFYAFLENQGLNPGKADHFSSEDLYPWMFGFGEIIRVFPEHIVKRLFAMDKDQMLSSAMSISYALTAIHMYTLAAAHAFGIDLEEEGSRILEKLQNSYVKLPGIIDFRDANNDKETKEPFDPELFEALLEKIVKDLGEYPVDLVDEELHGDTKKVF